MGLYKPHNGAFFGRVQMLRILVFEFCNLATRLAMLRAYALQGKNCDVEILGAEELEPNLDGRFIVERVKSQEINGVLLSGLPRADEERVSLLISELVKEKVPCMVVSSNMDWRFGAMLLQVPQAHILEKKENAITTFKQLLEVSVS